VIEIRQERPMLDLSLFRRPAFVGVQLATFCIGAGMFALLPFLSIYLQCRTSSATRRSARGRASFRSRSSSSSFRS
jgi:predicted MFS family arabinose efflux permease